ncbi:MAG: cobaltochelatase subunit CobN [Gammaproteobacteria bacterium]
MIKMIQAAVLLAGLVISASLFAATPVERSPRVLFIGTEHVSSAKMRTIQLLANDIGLAIGFKRLADLPEDAGIRGVVGGAELLVLDSVNSNEALLKFGKYVPELQGLAKHLRIVAIRAPNEDGFRFGVSALQAKRLHDYYWNGGRENLRRMMAFIQQEILGNQRATVAPPIIYPELGVYHPDYPGRVFADIDKYLQWQAARGFGLSRPVIGIALHQATLSGELTGVTDAIIRKLEAHGALPLPFYYATGRDAPDYPVWLSRDGEPLIDVLVNNRVIHWPEKRRVEFERLDVPVIQTLLYAGSEAEWRADEGGIPVNLIPFYLNLTEMSGVQGSIIVGASGENNEGPQPIEEQVTMLAARATRLARLRSKKNSEKKVAILYYNYPAGQRNLGASFLNVPRSLENIFLKLRKAGYRTEATGMSTPAEQDFIRIVESMHEPLYRHFDDFRPGQLLRQGLAASLPLSEYRAWFDTLPEKSRKPIMDFWNEPEWHFMVDKVNGEDHFIIPMMKSGNLLVLPQPPRGNKYQRLETIYHSKTLPVNHFYLAVYLYLQKYFGADALVHLGTHGSQEWLPGKERGLWAYDPGNLAAGDLPIIYPYIVDDVGEALQAKRRGRAVTISHMTPPFAPSGLYRELSEVHELMHQYTQMDDGPVRQRTKRRIVELTGQMNVLADMGWNVEHAEREFDTYLGELHDYLHELSSEHQPLGLHSFGHAPESTLLVTTLLQILGPEFAEQSGAYEGVAHSDHRHTHGEGRGHSHFHGGEAHRHDDHAHEHDHGEGKVHKHSHAAGSDHGHDHGTGHTHAHDITVAEDLSDLTTLPGFRLLQRYVIEAAELPGDLPESLRESLLRGRDLYRRIVGLQELPNLEAALAGRFVPPSTGGDPIRNEESLPTGRNLYGFDPSRVPTKAAWETGVALVTGMIDEYVKKHGRYPDKMAFSLWSIETMRHYGVLESQALYAMGMRPVWAPNGRVTGSEIIPYSELKRPRIDVVLSATGLYRDAFPDVMQRLAEAVEQVAQLKEENNFVYRHTQRLKKELEEQGLSSTDARYLATARIFSNERGTYGSGLASSIEASDTWNSDTELADLYLARMGFVYGSDTSRWGEKLENVDLYGRNLSGTDIAIFSRSSNIYGLLSSDDPFQYLGGLSLAVRRLDGNSPEMFISNLRNPDLARTETVARFLSRELRTRYLHPRWIGEMKVEGYSGTLAVQSAIANFWGWQVVDPQNVRNDQWQEFYEVYVNDKYELELREWFEKHNPEALARVMITMLEAIRKNYWQADAETLQNLLDTYRELDARINVMTENEDFKDFVEVRAAGFGVNALSATTHSAAPTAPAPAPSPMQEPRSQEQTVTGKKLEKVAAAGETDYQLQWMWLLLLAAVLAGFAVQSLPRNLRWQTP